MLPRYPIYLPTKGRAERARALTVRFLQRDRVPFRVVVEEQERDAYAQLVGADSVLVLPFANLGQGSIPARNWIIEHAISEGHERHWQLDDNIGEVLRVYRGRRIPCDSGPAFACVEDFVDRYSNVALAGLAYRFFLAGYKPPISRNVHVYSCTLVNNAIPQRWRGRYNEDTDLCLQVLADGWCTVLVHVFACDKKQTMLVKGGNTAELYVGDGRLEMARELERRWPGVVHVTRRFGRPQHVITAAWRRFDTPLVLRDDVKLDELPDHDEYGLDLVERVEVKSERLRAVRDELAAL